MAALRGTVQGEGASASRQAHHVLHTDADTWKTFVDVDLRKDGSGTICVKREGKQVCYMLNEESKPLKMKRA